MRARVLRALPLLLVVGLLVAAGSPALNGVTRDGKARAIEAGLLDLEQLQEDAVASGIANGGWNAGATAAAAIPGVPCTAGFAGPFPCHNVDLLSQVPIPLLGAPTGSDVWGWTDPETGREIAIPTTNYGMAFVDVTDPTSPVVLGRIYVRNEGSDDVLWRDVKVHNDHAFLVSEHVETNLIVFDLNSLDDVTSDQGILEPTYVYEGITDAHNIALNEETGIAYPVAGGECNGGMSMLDVNDPANIEVLGCVDDESLGLNVEETIECRDLVGFTGDMTECLPFGVVHDAQCVIYRGEDVRYQGHEICFTANEERGVYIVDVTDKDNPKLLSRRIDERIHYAHQGWLTADHKYWVFGDETDELLNGRLPTVTYSYEVTDLENPGEIKIHEHGYNSIDHNLYIEDGYVWEANYSAGLRVLDYTPESIAEGQFEEVAYFDVDPGEEVPVFAGAWTSYPFFESGTIVVNTFDSGMFLLKANLPEKTVETPPYDGPAVSPAADDGGTPAPEPAPADDASGPPLPATGGGLALLGIVLVGAALTFRRFGRTG